MDNARVQLVYQEAARRRRESPEDNPPTGAIVVVTGAKGHTPQVVGAVMLVTESGIVGTVGGGRFEHEVINRARAARHTQRLELHLGADLAMCCGGIMEVLITPLSEASWLEEVDAAITAGRDVWLLTQLGEPGAGDSGAGDSGAGDSGLGTRRLEAVAAAPGGKRRFEHAGIIERDGCQWLAEHLIRAPRLWLFGAGHVAAPTARIAHLLGYRVVVVDDRPEWNTPERFPDAERRLDPYEDAVFELDLDPRDSVLIITQGHEFDQLILEAVVERPLAYLGMIGSRSKTHKALKRLRTRGIDEQHIAAVHSPIGLEIGALTPEEIAVSITAEMIQVRRQSASESAGRDRRTEAA